jgi:hypothetical protein
MSTRNFAQGETVGGEFRRVTVRQRFSVGVNGVGSWREMANGVSKAIPKVEQGHTISSPTTL